MVFKKFGGLLLKRLNGDDHVLALALSYGIFFGIFHPEMEIDKKIMVVVGSSLGFLISNRVCHAYIFPVFRKLRRFGKRS